MILTPKSLTIVVCAALPVAAMAAFFHAGVLLLDRTDGVLPPEAAQPFIPEAISQEEVPGALNLRDLAGASRTVKLKEKTVYRSARLDLADKKALEDFLGKGALIIDLRRDAERDRHPDPKLTGIDWMSINIWAKDGRNYALSPLKTTVTGASSYFAMRGTSAWPWTWPKAAKDWKRKEFNQAAMYPDFVTLPGARAKFAEVLTTIADRKNPTAPVLFHCEDGKDRTGWTAYLLLTIAGVPEDEIIADWRASRVHLRNVHAVEDYWLKNARRAVNSYYGDIDTYIRDGLGIDDTTRARIRDVLVK